ncbi:MAG: LysR substrate-binding domain-containing protein [Formivibrio sp.]|nr:LysR substrate-binding domain-containing protein [Formivibrio sp.]
MRHITFDLDILRSFVLGTELGSFSQAADRVGRSTAAVSAQLKKLEDQLGTPILRKAGRHLELTPAGETLLAYARRLLELNYEAVTAVRGVELEGTVRIGLQEDFGENLLPSVLGLFARSHPHSRIEARVARKADLLEGLTTGRLDLALAWDAGPTTAHKTVLGTLPLGWIGLKEGLTTPWLEGEPVPLVACDAPCMMRNAATTALDRAGIPWRMAFTSANLSGIWAALAAGLGVTVRTCVGMPETLKMRSDLPVLHTMDLVLHRAEADPAPAIQKLAVMIEEQFHEKFPHHAAHSPIAAMDSD